MRLSLFCAALIVASSAVLPQAEAASRTMTVRLEDGRTVTFKVVKYHGKMMVMAPMSIFGRSDRN